SAANAELAKSSPARTGRMRRIISISIRPDGGIVSGHGRYNSGAGGSKSTEPRFVVRCVAASLSYDVLTVWMPHSVLGLPRQRPAPAASSGDVPLLQGMHPTVRKPDATSGCGGSCAAT